MMAKFMLPWFGGAQSVWTTCILFFQLLLLGGYAYAHMINSLPPRGQAVLHLAVVAVCVASMATLALLWGSPKPICRCWPVPWCLKLWASYRC